MGNIKDDVFWPLIDNRTRDYNGPCIKILYSLTSNHVISNSIFNCIDNDVDNTIINTFNHNEQLSHNYRDP